MNNAHTKRPHRPLGRLHSSDPADAAWRENQAHVDADIEGIKRDPQAEAIDAQMDRDSIPIDEQIQRIKAHYVRHEDPKRGK